MSLSTGVGNVDLLVATDVGDVDLLLPTDVKDTAFVTASRCRRMTLFLPPGVGD